MTAVPSVKKACGDCTLCCKVMAIEELAKTRGLPVLEIPDMVLRTIPE